MRLLSFFSVKETFVAGDLDENNSPEMLKMCQWYTGEERGWLLDSEERGWLLDRTWDISFIINCCSILFGFLSMVVILISSTCSLKIKTFRALALGFGINAILSMSPILILLKSKVCSDGGVCDDSQTNCVSSCQLSTGSWQVLATSVMWISAMISSCVIGPTKADLAHGTTKELKDEESQRTITYSSSQTSSSDSDRNEDSQVQPP